MLSEREDAEIPALREEKEEDDFLSAVCSNNMELVKIALEKKDLTPGSKEYRDAAYRAAEAGHLEMLEFLASQGFDLNIGPYSLQWNEPKSPIEVAAHNHHTTVVDFLRKNNVKLPTIRTEEFIDAVEKHKFVLAQLVIEMNKDQSKRDVDINGVNKECLTPLYIFCKKGDVDAVQFLVNQGADMNVATVNNSGSGRRLPLWGAIQNGHKNVVDFLLQNGVDVDNCNRSFT